MPGVIKGILEEELQNSLRIRKDYESALSKLPQGCLVEKKIRGHKYYYIVRREGHKVLHLYRGKISVEEVNKYNEAKPLRAQYRHGLSKVKRQIRFLRGVLRGKESI
jgi:hypothetical protein